MDVVKNKPYQLYEETNNNVDYEHIDTIKYTHEKTPVACLFFSKKNVDALQIGMRNMVLDRSKGRFNIGRQSDRELLIVMRSIYLTYGLNLSYEVVEQVRALNKRVLDYCVKEVLVEAEKYVQYKNDVANLPVPIDRGAHISSAGSKTLFMKEF